MSVCAGTSMQNGKMCIELTSLCVLHRTDQSTKAKKHLHFLTSTIDPTTSASITE